MECAVIDQVHLPIITDGCSCLLQRPHKGLCFAFLFCVCEFSFGHCGFFRSHLTSPLLHHHRIFAVVVYGSQPQLFRLWIDLCKSGTRGDSTVGQSKGSSHATQPSSPMSHSSRKMSDTQSARKLEMSERNEFTSIAPQ